MVDRKTMMKQTGPVGLIADRRQLGGLMILLGTCATVEPITDFSYFLGTADFPSASALQIASFAAGALQIIFGSLATIVGYLSLIHDYGNAKLSGALLVLIQAAWVPFVTRIYSLVIETSSPYEIDTKEFQTSDGQVVSEEFVSNIFIPEEYLPTTRDVQTVGSMAIIGEISYMTAFYGALALTAFATYSFDAGKPTSRDARFYRGRLLFYSFVVAVAGLSQLLLGAYILIEFGGGPLHPSINAAMYTVHYSEITIAVGALQMIVGYFGIARFLGFVPVEPDNHQFQLFIFLQWISMLTMQYLAQISLSLEEEQGKPTHLSSMVLLSVGINILPAFLDYKMRNIPSTLSQTYYEIGNARQLKPPNQVYANKSSSAGNQKNHSRSDDLQDRDTVKNQNDAKNSHSDTHHGHFMPQSVGINSESDTEDGRLQEPLVSSDFLASTLLDDPQTDSQRKQTNAMVDMITDDVEFTEENADQVGFDVSDDVEVPAPSALVEREGDQTAVASNTSNTPEQILDDNLLDNDDNDDEEDDDGPPGLFSDDKITKAFSDDHMWDQAILSRDPPGSKKFQKWKVQKKPTVDDEEAASDTPDDSTSILEERLEEIERELYTDSMEAFHQSLTEIL